MGVLVGDVNGDGAVNSGDALVTRNRGGQQADMTNFRSDINTDGVINGGDTISVRSRGGTALPSPNLPLREVAAPGPFVPGRGELFSRECERRMNCTSW
jgi:hypothetical protein